MSKKPSVAEDLLLTGRQRVILIVGASVMFIAAGPILGWRPAVGAVMTGVASILVTIAIAEVWVHKRQQTIENQRRAQEETRRDHIRRSLGDDLFKMSGFPVEIFAAALDMNGWPPDKGDPSSFLAFIGKLRDHFGEAECDALAAHDGSINPKMVSEEDLRSHGLLSRYHMRWCAQSLVDHLLLFVYDVPGRLLESHLDEAAADSTRRLARLLPDWKRLGEQEMPFPHPSAFLSTVKETLDACEPVLAHLETWPDDVRPKVDLTATRRDGPVFTSWPDIRRRHEYVR